MLFVKPPLASASDSKVSAPPVFADGQVHHACAHGLRIAYEVVGEGNPLMLVPGFSQSRCDWKHTGLVDAFVSAGRKVILVDPRGHGASDKPHDPAAYHPAAVARDQIAVLDSLGITVADVLGYSRGAWIAIATAISYPERVGAVIAGGAHPYAENMSSFRTVVSGGMEEWVSLLESEVGPLAPDTKARLIANDIDALRAALADDRKDLSNELARSGVPAMFYAGSKDPRAAAALRFANATSNAQFMELEGLNHFQAFFAVGPVVTLTERVREGSEGRC